MTFRALVPVNRLDRAKGRLADALDPGRRAELALATLATVLDAVEEAGGSATVLTADDIVRSRVQSPHSVLDEDPGLRGLNPQLERAVALLDLQAVLILHGDLPLVTAADIEAVIAAAPPSPSATLVESADGGTNAMWLQPPGGFALHYGPGSAALHRAAAEAAGYTVAVANVPGIALDLDTPADIATLLGSAKGRTSGAGRLLRSWGFDASGVNPV